MKVTQMSAASKPFLKQEHNSASLNTHINAGKKFPGSILSSFQKDDYILAAILVALVFEGCDDYVLLAVLGYLFVVGLDFFPDGFNKAQRQI